VPGATLFMQAAQDLNVGGRTTRTQYQYTLQDSDINELNDWAPKAARRAAEAADAARCGLRSADQQRHAVADHRPRSGGAFRHSAAAVDKALYDAFGQRQAAQFFTQANSYHVVLEITPSLQTDPASLSKLYLKSRADRPDGAAVGDDQVRHAARDLSVDQSPGAVSRGHAVVQSRAGRGARRGRRCDQPRIGRHAPAGTITGTFQGTAQAFQSSLKTQPYLILAALVAVYIILGMLYESYIHPLTILSTLPSAGVGALLVLLIFHIDLSVMALIGIILLIGIVKKNGIMMVDFAIQAEREQHLSPHDAIRQACLLRFRPIMMTTMAACSARCRWRWGAAPARNCASLGYTMVGGLDREPGIDAVHDARHLPVSGQFSLWLKRRRGHPRGPTRSGCGRRRAAWGNAVKILLVEDNERVSQFVVKGLQEAGHTTDHAANGRDGMFLAASEPYDVIIMDRMLPGDIDGLAIIEVLRKAGKRTPILILSALSEVDDRIRGLRSGGDDYLTKPFAFGELLARFDALHRRAQASTTRFRSPSATCIWIR
jgi:CheY-like chemotaxis protein